MIIKYIHYGQVGIVLSMKRLILEKYLDKICPISRLKKRKDQHLNTCRKLRNKIQHFHDTN